MVFSLGLENLWVPIAPKKLSRNFRQYRGLVENNDLLVPVLNTRSTTEQVSLSKSKKFAGSAEPVQPVLTRPLQ